MSAKQALLWILGGAVAVAAYVAMLPASRPFGPDDWQLNAREAEAQALESLRALGEPVVDPYVVTTFSTASRIERRLHLEAKRIGEAELADGELASQIFYWEVHVYGRDRHPRDWTYRAELGLDGEVLALRKRLRDDEGSGARELESGREEAERFLTSQGYDMADFAEPESRQRQLEDRTDLTLRYQYRDLQLGDRFPYGLEVLFAGDELMGYKFWFEDPEEDALRKQIQPFTFLELGKTIAVLFLLPLVAVPFVRRYHAGEIGVRRGLQIGGAVFLLGVVLILLTGDSLSQGSSSGVTTRVQMTFLTSAFFIGLVFVPISILTALTWSVGEALCRERTSGKLAAFDAFLQGQWTNATVARSCLRGLVCGAGITAILTLAGLGLKAIGVRTVASFHFSGWWYSSPWPGLVVLVFFVLWMLYAELFGRLFLVSLAAGKMGWLGGGLAAAVVGGVLLYGPAVPVSSLSWYLVTAIVGAALLVTTFVRFDLLTSLSAGLTSALLAFGYPLLSASDSWLQLQGASVFFVAALPALVSLRSLTSGKEFHYRYDDIPAHVRRIADRERQKVELETARRIQSSILPELPPEVNGVRVAHAYLPASEVGGDFYDVLALEDGRLAVAVGDVAGHGVSSGLVMSMAKSALAVQVTFRPEVEDVFGTLNRMIFQSARKRLLTTLCYALIEFQLFVNRDTKQFHLFV